MSLSADNYRENAVCRIRQTAFSYIQKLLVFILALLICNTAGGLASRLAGSLALTASARLYALRKVTCFNRLDSFHSRNLLIKHILHYTTFFFVCQWVLIFYDKDERKFSAGRTDFNAGHQKPIRF